MPVLISALSIQVVTGNAEKSQSTIPDNQPKQHLLGSADLNALTVRGQSLNRRNLINIVRQFLKPLPIERQDTVGPQEIITG